MDAAEYDSIRRTVKAALFPMSLKGYFGASVKGRILELGDAGKPLAADRMAVLKALAAVDTYCYQKQTGKSGDGDPKAALEASLVALDAVIAKLK